MDKMQIELAKVIENYFGADAGYLDIDVFTLAKRIMESGWEKPVRCEDCKYYRKKGGVYKDDYCAILYYGEGTHRTACERDFCSYGKKREV